MFRIFVAFEINGHGDLDEVELAERFDTPEAAIQHVDENRTSWSGFDVIGVYAVDDRHPEATWTRRQGWAIAC